MKIYVGNLSYDATEDGLKQAFEEFGAVASVSIFKDKHTGEPKGFGFIEMPEVSEGQAAIKGMNDKEFLGRKLKVDQAKERPANSRGGERRFSRGGGGGFRDGNRRGSGGGRDGNRRGGGGGGRDGNRRGGSGGGGRGRY